MSRCNIHQRLTLWATEGSYVLEPPSSASSEPSLVINRRNGQLTLQPFDAQITRMASPVEVRGIMGILTLTTTDFLILITDSEVQGHLVGHEVHRATQYKVLPIAPHLTTTQLLNHPIEKRLLALVHSHLYSATLHYSYTYDMTRRMQAQWVAQEMDANKAPWEAADTRFFWNYHVSTKLIHSGLDLGRFVIPIVYGTFDTRRARIKARDFQLTLISRRSRFRAGTRYFARGIDSEGHVANYNETEQIVTYPDGSRTVHVQTRGSIPVFWAEVNNLRYKPDMQIMEWPDQIHAIQMHLKEQVALYGSTILVNLVNTKGHEQPVCEAYERNVRLAKVDNVKYHHFDFHHECKAMRWDRISVLLDQLTPEMEAKGYFHLSPSGETRMLQSNVVRTNCMDNLDRTNVVQSDIAKWSLNRQLQIMGYLSQGETINDHDELLTLFRNMWADHADSISIAYSGTGALKTDFTRTGKRTLVGNLADGFNGATRYIKNNYYDGPRQDGFDLFTGAWVSRGPPSALGLFYDSRPLFTRSMPYICAFSLFMILAGLTLPRTSHYSLIYFFLLWFLIFFFSLFYIRAHGVEYVSWPRLIPLDDVIYYDGPGFRSRKAPSNPAYQSAAGRGRLTTSKPQRIGMEEVEMGQYAKQRTD